MLQSWETFFSPTGGYMDNKLETGYTGLAVDFGSSLVNKYIYSPLERKELKYLYKRQHKAFQRFAPGSTPLFDGGYRTGTTAELARVSPEAKERLLGRYNKRIGAVKSKYGSLKTTAKMVGWGYLGLTAAAGVQAALAPGVSRAAIESNNNLVAPTLDTNIAYTQRQRALMAIHDSQLGIRNVISQEATSFHK